MAEPRDTGCVAMNNNDVLEEKKHLLEERLKKREDERLAHIEKRREEKSSVTSGQENALFFQETFSQEKNNLEAELLTCDSLDKNNLVDKFDEISKMHQKLQRFLAESTMFLPSYDVRQTQDILSKLSTKIQEKRDELLPKKKFAFKSKKKGTGLDKDIDPKKEVKQPDVIDLADCKFTDKKNETLTMDSSINSKDVALARLDSCTVKLYGAPSAIHINDLKNCTVLSGPVSGSIFIRECKNCEFVVPCQQLRIHTTTGTKFYIHVTSRAIIEDCSAVSFGPYNWTYPDIDAHYELSGLDRSRNSWDDIDDFNWLAADKHSPNWNLIPESERKNTWE